MNALAPESCTVARQRVLRTLCSGGLEISGRFVHLSDTSYFSLCDILVESQCLRGRPVISTLSLDLDLASSSKIKEVPFSGSLRYYCNLRAYLSNDIHT